ncbi:MAG: leucine-rich repeat domain-containing protein [Prevotella sp.]|jgi:hypothetical protein|nr:leucine-rich repeat domain-containing protein [Prevotella sp.]MCI2081476.1 leucine-rich repeat domain-containing protein [Prevotella sp.]MCI2103354.1 leucine-rich repeat domain-containing protein [Prevotella sp.]
MKYSTLKNILPVVALLLGVSCSDETETLSDLKGGDEVSQVVLDQGNYALSKEGGLTEFKFTNVSVDSFFIQSDRPDWLRFDNIVSVPEELDLRLMAQPNNEWDTRTAKLCLVKGKERKDITFSQVAFPKMESSTQVIKLAPNDTVFTFTVKTNVPVKMKADVADGLAYIFYDQEETSHEDGKAWTITVKGKVPKNVGAGKASTLYVMGDGVPTADVIVWQTGTVGDVNPVLNNLKPGALAEFLSADPNTTPYIKSLKVSGELNGDDIYALRTVLTRYKTLKTLDLFGARIVSGGKAYLTTALNEQYYTRNDEVGEDMFRNCTSLEKITLPEHLKAIGIHAFAYCSSLPWIEIPATVRSIGSQAFYSCTNMSFIGIPIDGSQLESIGSGAFSTSSVLDDLYIPASVKDLNKLAFSPCRVLELHVKWVTPPDVVITKNLAKGRLYVPKGCKAAYAADKNWGKFSEIQEE